MSMREPSLARRTGWLASAVLVCGCAGTAPSEPSSGEARVQADRQQLGRVVAYTAHVADGRCEPEGCQWRVLDPETSNDELVIALPAPPSRAFWDGDQAVEGAAVAVKPGEAASEPATLQKVAELLFDEAGQAFAVAQAGGLGAKGLRMFVHDLVEQTLRGVPPFVGRRGRTHS
jgi:hypothetical protein